ncbi:hypothetical protein Hypma_010964 [Hypsizygus marmoreus]|uniref:Uncharacterized protein n=1 Tax=Hypsizygus marmoreus TaxID=39966 RepID=A0A369JN11_HYPMA|nr:hypothetical protein Hypma_010964 [Hypsizygus marmoreus]
MLCFSLLSIYFYQEVSRKPCAKYDEDFGVFTSHPTSQYKQTYREGLQSSVNQAYNCFSKEAVGKNMNPSSLSAMDTPLCRTPWLLFGVSAFNFGLAVSPVYVPVFAPVFYSNCRVLPAFWVIASISFISVLCIPSIVRPWLKEEKGILTFEYIKLVLSILSLQVLWAVESESAAKELLVTMTFATFLSSVFFAAALGVILFDLLLWLYGIEVALWGSYRNHSDRFWEMMGSYYMVLHSFYDWVLLGTISNLGIPTVQRGEHYRGRPAGAVPDVKCAKKVSSTSSLGVAAH